jgi:hypothetical protein
LAQDDRLRVSCFDQDFDLLATAKRHVSRQIALYDDIVVAACRTGDHEWQVLVLRCIRSGVKVHAAMDRVGLYDVPTSGGLVVQAGHFLFHAILQVNGNSASNRIW